MANAGHHPTMATFSGTPDLGYWYFKNLTENLTKCIKSYLIHCATFLEGDSTRFFGILENFAKVDYILRVAISYTVGFVSRRRPFSTEAQIGLSYTVEKGLFRPNFFRLSFPTGASWKT